MIDPARKALRELISVVEQAVKFLDEEMKKPSTNERGKRIAAICNALELQKDIAKRFGLPRRKTIKKTAGALPSAER